MPGYLVGVIAGGNGLVTKDPNFGPNPPTIEAGRFVVDRFAVPFTLTLEASGSWLVSEYSSTLVSISQASPGVVPGGTFAVFTGAPAAVAGIVAVDEASATAICPGATFAPVQEATLSDAPAVKVTGVAAAACAPNPVTFIGPNTTFEVTIGMLDGRVIGVIASAPTGQWGAGRCPLCSDARLAASSRVIHAAAPAVPQCPSNSVQHCRDRSLEA